MERRGEVRKIGVVKPTLSIHEKVLSIFLFIFSICLSLAILINDETMRRVVMEMRGGVMK